MTPPTRGETLSRFLEHIRLAQESAAMMAHLTRADGASKDQLIAQGWLAVEENLRRMVHVGTTLAQGRLQ